MTKIKKCIPTNRSCFIKGLLLYILPLPILLTLFLALLNGDFIAIVTNGVAYGLFLLGATTARKGFLIEKEYKDSTLAKAPKIKYKSISAVILALALVFTSYFCTSNGLFLSILLGVVSFIGFYPYYGLDPKVDKIGDLNIGVNAGDVIEITSKKCFMGGVALNKIIGFLLLLGTFGAVALQTLFYLLRD